MIATAGIQPLSSETFERLRRLIHETTGIWMRDGKQILVANRLRRRLAALGLESYDAYLALLERPPGGPRHRFDRSDARAAEMAHFIDAVSTNETYFYRESGHLRALETAVLSRLLPRGRPVRLWCAGSSTGEEAYTLRIACDEAERRYGGSVEITGTDISTAVIAAAREGLYRERSVRHVPPAILGRCFSPEGEGRWRVRPELRERVGFRVHNLLADPAPAEGPFDVIFCRNVMIYFDKPTQKRLVDGVFASAIRPDGWLFIGHAESLMGTSERFAYRPVTVAGVPPVRTQAYRPVAVGRDA
jgi:chemotaxis protein methyltransferase CheR